MRKYKNFPTGVYVLRDSSKEEIFEGDIIENNNGTYEVTFEEGCFLAKELPEQVGQAGALKYQADITNCKIIKRHYEK